MKHSFQLEAFPNSNFDIETSKWTGKAKLLKDNVPIEQSKEKGKPYLIPTETGEIIKAFPKQSFPDVVPALEINGTRYHIVEQLKWFQYILAGLPIILLFIGGILGGVVGAVSTSISLNIFRQEGTESSKYLKVIGVVAATFVIYFLLATFLFKLINRGN